MPKKFYGADDDKMYKGYANMPEEKVMKEYPKVPYGCAEKVNDRIDGIDMLAKDNHKQIMKKPGGRHDNGGRY